MNILDARDTDSFIFTRRKVHGIYKGRVFIWHGAKGKFYFVG